MKQKQWRPKPTLERNKMIRQEYKKLRLEMNAPHAIEILCVKYCLSFQSMKNRIARLISNKIEKKDVILNCSPQLLDGIEGRYLKTFEDGRKEIVTIK